MHHRHIHHDHHAHHDRRGGGVGEAEKEEEEVGALPSLEASLRKLNELEAAKEAHARSKLTLRERAQHRHLLKEEHKSEAEIVERIQQEASAERKAQHALRKDMRRVEEANAKQERDEVKRAELALKRQVKAEEKGGRDLWQAQARALVDQEAEAHKRSEEAEQQAQDAATAAVQAQQTTEAQLLNATHRGLQDAEHTQEARAHDEEERRIAEENKRLAKQDRLQSLHERQALDEVERGHKRQRDAQRKALAELNKMESRTHKAQELELESQVDHAEVQERRAHHKSEKELARLSRAEEEAVAGAVEEDKQQRTRGWVDSARMRKREDTMRRVEAARAGHQEREQLAQMVRDMADQGDAAAASEESADDAI